MTEERSKSDTEAGATLIELIIYGLLSALLLTLVAVIFINAWVAQAATVDRDAATGQANAVTASLQQTVRNSTHVRSPNGATLVATVATGGTPECRVWIVDDGKLKYKRGEYAGGEFSTVPDDTWATLASEVRGTLAGAAFSTPTSTEAVYGLEFAQSGDTARAAPVAVNGTVVAQAFGGSGQC